MLGHIIYIPGLDGSVFTELLDPDLGVKTPSGSAVDPHWFKCRSDPDFHVNAVPDPVPKIKNSDFLK